MANGVCDALKKVLITHGKMNKLEADNYVTKMKVTIFLTNFCKIKCKLNLKFSNLFFGFRRCKKLIFKPSLVKIK